MRKLAAVRKVLIKTGWERTFRKVWKEQGESIEHWTNGKDMVCLWAKTNGYIQDVKRINSDTEDVPLF